MVKSRPGKKGIRVNGRTVVPAWATDVVFICPCGQKLKYQDMLMGVDAKTQAGK